MTTILALLGAIVAWAVPVRAEVVINNGSAPPDPANVIDIDLLDSLYVQNVGCDFTAAPPPCVAPGAPTTVAFVAGGASEGVLVSETSVVRFETGSTTLGVAYANSPTIEIHGGFLPVNIGPLSFPGFEGAPQITLTSGDVGIVDVRGDGHLTQTGGHVDTLQLGIDSSGFVPVGTLSGGSVDDVRLEHNGELYGSGTVLGGIVSYGGGFARISGGSLATLDMQTDVFDAGEVEFVGHSFAVDGIPAIGEISAASGTLTGTLASGNPLSVAFTRAPEATIRLVALPPQVPTLSSLGLGLLAATMAVLGFRRLPGLAP